MAAPLNILVVEDDRDLRESIVETLEDAGHSVASAPHGEVALEWLQKATTLPDLILLDLTMPVMGGARFRVEQQRHEKLSNVPIVLLAAGDEVHVVAKRLGAVGHFKKPFEVRALLDFVSDFPRAP